MPPALSARGGDERSHDQRQAPPGEGQRRDVRDPAGGVLERPLQPLADRSSVPTDVEDETQVDAGRHQSEPDQVEVALLEPFGQGVRITACLAQPRTRPSGRGRPGGLAAGRARPLATAFACQRNGHEAGSAGRVARSAPRRRLWAGSTPGPCPLRSVQQVGAKALHVPPAGRSID